MSELNCLCVKRICTLYCGSYRPVRCQSKKKRLVHGMGWEGVEKEKVRGFFHCNTYSTGGDINACVNRCVVVVAVFKISSLANTVLSMHFVAVYIDKSHSHL